VHRDLISGGTGDEIPAILGETLLGNLLEVPYIQGSRHLLFQGIGLLGTRPLRQVAEILRPGRPWRVALLFV